MNNIVIFIKIHKRIILKCIIAIICASIIFGCADLIKYKYDMRTTEYICQFNDNGKFKFSEDECKASLDAGHGLLPHKLDNLDKAFIAPRLHMLRDADVNPEYVRKQHDCESEYVAETNTITMPYGCTQSSDK